MSDVEYAVHGGVGRITLNRPDRMNAVTVDLAKGLADVILHLGDCADIRVIVIAGAGGNFCAGGDFEEVERLSARGPSELRTLFVEFGRACQAIASVAVPVIAAVEGAAAAGGFELMQAADIVLVAESAQISDSHVKFGMIPGGGGTARLPRIVGRQTALAVLLSGDRYTGTEAVGLGLAYRAFPDPEFSSAVDTFVNRLASRDRAAVATIKRLVYNGIQAPLAHAISGEIDAVVAHICSGVGSGAAAAFGARRTPS